MAISASLLNHYSGSGTSNFTIPSSAKVGDIVVVMTGDNSNNTGSTVAISGFTVASGGHNGRRAWYKVVTSSDKGKSVSVTSSGTRQVVALLVTSTTGNTLFVDSADCRVSPVSLSNYPCNYLHICHGYSLNSVSGWTNVSPNSNSANMCFTYSGSKQGAISLTTPTASDDWHSGAYQLGHITIGERASVVPKISTTFTRSTSGNCRAVSVQNTYTHNATDDIGITLKINCNGTDTLFWQGKKSTIPSTLSFDLMDLGGLKTDNTDNTIYLKYQNTTHDLSGNSNSVKFKVDGVAPTISFPSATYNTQRYEGETVTLFNVSDANDNTLDWDYKVYVDDTLYSSYTMVNHNTLKLPYFENMPESYKLKIEVRARQSSDTANSTGADIWSEWHTSPVITIKSPVIFSPTFNNIKWYQDIEQQAIISPFTEFETQHYCNGELYATTPHPIGLTPPLLYTPVKPHLWSYEYYTFTRAKNNEGVWSGWYKSPVVEVQFNVQPNDITFSKKLPDYFIEGEIVTIEWDESLDLNSTKTTYTVSLMNNDIEELFEIRGVEEPRLTFTVPKGIISNQITLGIVAYSDGLYSNPVSSPNLAITDVKVMDCTLDFPRLTTNVLGEFKKLALEINNDRRVEFEDNLDNYLLPLHYFRKGENILTLIATDRNDVEITRSWKVTLDFNLQDLEQVNKIDLKGYVSFNHNESEQYVPCATLFKPNLDLGVVEHELYGSTTFEGADTITQKLVITRDEDSDLTQLRTLKITGAIE